MLKLKLSFENLHKGLQEIKVTDELSNKFQMNETIKLEMFFEKSAISIEPPKANEYFVLHTKDNLKVIGKYSQKEKALFPLLKVPNLWGIKPKLS